jgi:hypothetical protein
MHFSVIWRFGVKVVLKFSSLMVVSLFCGFSASVGAAQSTQVPAPGGFQEKLSDLIFELKDYKSYRLRSVENEIQNLKDIQTSSGFQRCESTGNMDACNKVISKAYHVTLIGYDQSLSYYFSDAMEQAIDERQVAQVERLKQAFKLMGVPDESDSQGCTSLEPNHANVIPAEGAWTDRVVVEDLVCRGIIAVANVKLVNRDVALQFFAGLKAKANFQQIALRDIDKNFPELK